MKALFWLGVAFPVIAPISLGVLGHGGTAWVALLSGVFITLISRLSDIAEITVGPIKAKMREFIE